MGRLYHLVRPRLIDQLSENFWTIGRVDNLPLAYIVWRKAKLTQRDPNWWHNKKNNFILLNTVLFNQLISLRPFSNIVFPDATWRTIILRAGQISFNRLVDPGFWLTLRYITIIYLLRTKFLQGILYFSIISEQI